MEKIVFFKNGKLFFDTRMSENAFVKTGRANNIRESGVLVELQNNNAKTSLWNFDSTISSLELKEFSISTKETIFLEGCGFEFLTLQEILAGSPQAEQIKVAIAYFNALDVAVKTNKKILSVGAGGVLFSLDFTKVLFLPCELFNASVHSLSNEDFLNAQGFYENPALQDNALIDFIKATVVYKIITGSFPFGNPNNEQRKEDIRDLNYRPLRYLVPNVNEKILLWSEKSFASSIKKKDLQFPQEELLNFKNIELSKEENDLFKEKANIFFEKQQKSISFKRKLRANSTPIKICCIVVLVALVIGVSLFNSSQEKRTTKGLTSIQTLEMYYSAINLLDIDSARNSSSKNLSARVDRIGNIFVTGKTSSMYTPEADLVPPAVWLIKNRLVHNIYGVTNFKIDEINYGVFKKGPRKNAHPNMLLEENGETLSNGVTKKYLVDFYILETYPEDDFVIAHQKENVTVEFKKNRWIVSDIQTEVQSETMKFSSFKKEYETTMKNCNNDIFECAEELRKKYNFISTKKELQDAIQYLKGNSLAYGETEITKEL